MTVTIRGQGGRRLQGLPVPRAETAVPGILAECPIDTIRGPVEAGALAAGDLVFTRDAGYRPVRWVGCCGALAEIAALAMPAEGGTLVLAPGQLLLIAGPAVAAACGEPEALAAAGDLAAEAGGPAGSRSVAVAGQAMVLFLLDTHEIVRAGGTWCASGRPDAALMRALDEGARAGLLAAFPELRLPGGDAAFRAARPVLDAAAARAALGLRPAAQRRRAA